MRADERKCQRQRADWWTGCGYAERVSTLLTDLAYQRLPRGVLMPRALRASAIW